MTGFKVEMKTIAARDGGVLTERTDALGRGRSTHWNSRLATALPAAMSRPSSARYSDFSSLALHLKRNLT